MDSVLASHPVALGLILDITNKNTLDVAWIQNSGTFRKVGRQLDKVNGTHLVLARGKLGLKKYVGNKLQNLESKYLKMRLYLLHYTRAFKTLSTGFLSHEKSK